MSTVIKFISAFNDRSMKHFITCSFEVIVTNYLHVNRLLLCDMKSCYWPVHYSWKILAGSNVYDVVSITWKYLSTASLTIKILF